MRPPDDSLFPKFGRGKETVNFRDNSFQESVLRIRVPNSTSVVVKGVDFEPLRDAEGICKAMVESYGKLWEYLQTHRAAMRLKITQGSSLEVLFECADTHTKQRRLTP